MFVAYYIFRLKSLLRIAKKIHVAIVLIALLAWFVVLGAYHLSAGYRLALFIGLSLLLNEKRTDWYFLECQYRKRARMIFISDNIILSLPFVIMHLLHSEFFWAPLPVLLSFVIPLLPRYNVSFTIPGWPLFPKGAFEFQRVFRYMVIPNVVLFSAGLMGIIYDNIHLIEVCTALVCILSAMLLWQTPERSWVMNFCSLRQFIKMKTLHTLICGTEIMLPFLLLLYVGGVSLYHVLLSLVAYLFLLEQVEMARFVVSTDTVLTCLLFFALCIVNYLSLGIPVVFCLSFVIWAGLAFMCYTKISAIVND